ncbi:hypothetical protein DSL72_002663 [Monilinia vaccinii-corymbosi]|uniref:Uncharacterized protein n=1 Tax=Monilinia vaccinii-corymbosi TaxID=61207 RepID=A0A8A3PDA4_9HELO|nr:hypothetical protein DSL72_002663 [Monilinia vaccinii-corymbosi]
MILFFSFDHAEPVQRSLGATINLADSYHPASLDKQGHYSKAQLTSTYSIVHTSQTRLADTLSPTSSNNFQDPRRAGPSIACFWGRLQRKPGELKWQAQKTATNETKTKVAINGQSLKKTKASKSPLLLLS